MQGCTHLERNKGLAQVRVDVPKGLAPGKTEFVVMVHTPDATPEEPGWYVSAISSFDGAIKQARAARENWMCTCSVACSVQLAYWESGDV